jgi:hypothetical protein
MPRQADAHPKVFAAVHVGAVTGGLEWSDEVGLDPDVIYAAIDLGQRAASIRALVAG